VSVESTMNDYFLGVDIGSSGCKAILIDHTGQCLDKSREGYSSTYPREGWAEQNPDHWVQAACLCLQDILNRRPEASERIGRVCVVGVTHSFILLDRALRPLCNSMTMFDIRSAKDVDRLMERFGQKEIFQRTCNRIGTLWSWPQMEWIKQNQPRLWAESARVLFPKDYVRNHLLSSAPPVTDHIDASGTLLFDPRANQWIEEYLADLEKTSDFMPEIRTPFEVAGEVSKEASKLCGLKAGTPVIVGSTDTVAEMLGSGAVMDNDRVVKLASVGRIAMVGDQPVNDLNVLNYRHLIDDKWYPGTATKYAASSYAWLRNIVCSEIVTDDVYQTMDAMAAETEPGCGGLYFMPFLNGEWAPLWDDQIKGAFIGLSITQERRHLIRAVLEGVGYAIRSAIERMEGFGANTSDIRLIGRGSRSALWVDIVSGILGRPVLVPQEIDAAYGAALMALISGHDPGEHVDFVKKAVKIEREVVPDREMVASYQRRYQRYLSICAGIQAMPRDQS